MKTRRLGSRFLFVLLLVLATGVLALRQPVVPSESASKPPGEVVGAVTGGGGSRLGVGPVAASPHWRALARPAPSVGREKVRPAPLIRLRAGAPLVRDDQDLPLATTTILSDGFEGSFPGLWQLFYSTGTESTTLWGQSTFRHATNAHSAWCAGGGTQPRPAGGSYLPNMSVWLAYGPFDLSDATEATFDFDLWNDCEPSSVNPPPDRLTMWLSTDNFETSDNLQGFYFPNTNQQWTLMRMEASDFDQISAIGSRTVGVAFVFRSSSVPSAREGTYLDNVLVTKTTSTSACSLTCTPTVPSTGQAGTPVAFAATASATNCASAPTFTWEFGDGMPSSTQQNPSHTYTATGSHTWTLTVRAGSATCTKTGTITIATGPQAESTAATSIYWVPVASHAGGAQQSEWRTDLGILNLGAETANVEMVLHAPGHRVSGTDRLDPRTQAIFSDVVGQLGSSGSSALEVRSDHPLHVTSRTYNQANGTFGQDYDGVEEGEGAFGSQEAYLPQLIENEAYRTNISVTNTGNTIAAVVVELFTGTATKLAEYEVSLNPGQWKQENRPFFNKARQSAMGSGYARVRVTAGSGILASASVIDNTTNDPTTVPMLFAPVAGKPAQWLPVVSHSPGAENSQWRTDLGILNVGAAQAKVELRLYTTVGVLTAAETVGPRSQQILVDVMNRFSAVGSAALEVLADQPLVLSSRTYNQGPEGTFGQDYLSAASTDGVVAGDVVYLPQLVENADYRTNIGLANTGTGTAGARVELFSGSSKLTEYEVSLNPGQWKQESRPFKTKAGQTNMFGGYAKITITSGAGLLAAASVVDNLTNDPTTIQMKHTGTGTVAGTVIDTRGAPVPGAAVSAGGRSTVTNAGGSFALSGVPASNRVLVVASKAGHVDAHQVNKVKAGLGYSVQLTVAQAEAEALIPGPTGGSITTPDGGRVTIPPNGLVLPDGTPFTGTAAVAVTTFDPTNPGEASAFPGQLEGITLDGARIPFVSYGWVDINVTGGGQTLELAPSKSAILRVPIPPSLRDDAPPGLPAWWFNPGDGRWHEEQVFTRVGDAYETAVPHLSVWNCDVGADRCTVNGRVVDSGGNPVEGARVTFSNPARGVTSGETSTPRDGRFSVPVDRNGTIDYWAELGTVRSTTGTFVATCAVNNGNIDIGDIVLPLRVAWNISGNAGTDGATIKAGSVWTTSDGSGAYTLSNLKPGRYVVTPSKPGCTFQPGIRSVEVGPDGTNVSFTATCIGLPGRFTLWSPGNGVTQVPGTVWLQWGPSLGATSYDVFFGTTPNPPLLTNQPGTSRSVTVSAGQTYYWRVVARNAQGSTSSASGTWSFDVPGTTTPTPTPTPTPSPTPYIFENWQTDPDGVVRVQDPQLTEAAAYLALAAAWN
ncbi:MAG TPA: carboxypeptidase regulatory-like domain-containing protein, partial [Thermoanaerobaculaceae bacterium]|nr:carboxypeptidase regulatory-like domain-containing protein [Thermoanaerobaculaceae bacterium]